MVIGNCPVCGAEMRIGTDMTNADRLRSMSDEELADFLYVKTCEDGYPQFGTIREWRDWLKEEAE